MGGKGGGRTGEEEGNSRSSAALTDAALSGFPEAAGGCDLAIIALFHVGRINVSGGLVPPTLDFAAQLLVQSTA
jgi:hypothetical protein